jgi:hypothetical protein
VATAATTSAAALEGFRMLFAAMEAADGSFGGAPSATAAAGVVARMAGPLLVLLPGVVSAAVAGGLLGGSAAPPPVAWGIAAAAALAAGGGTLGDQLLWRPAIPALHTAAAAAAGAAAALLLHRQLLGWAGSGGGAAARKLMAKGGGGGRLPSQRLASEDLEAVQYASLYQPHHLHHNVQAAHPLFGRDGAATPPPGHVSNGNAAPHALLPDGPAVAGGGMNGFGGSASSLHQQAAYHRGGMGGLPGVDSAGVLGRSGGSFADANGAMVSHGGARTPLRSLRQAALLPPQQLAAGTAGLAAFAAAGVSAGWRLACTLLLLGGDRSAVILPVVALMLAGPGLQAGALARALPGRGGGAFGAWLGGGLASVVAGAAALTASRAREAAHMATLVRSYLYPLGTTDTAEALAGGALLAAGMLLFGAGAAVKAPAARGGLILGLAAAGAAAALRAALCAFSPYCLSVETLLSSR